MKLQPQGPEHFLSACAGGKQVTEVTKVTELTWLLIIEYSSPDRLCRREAGVNLHPVYTCPQGSSGGLDADVLASKSSNELRPQHDAVVELLEQALFVREGGFNGMCMCARVCSCIHMCACARVCAYMHVCARMRVFIHTCVCVHACSYIHVCVCVRVFIHPCVCL